MANARVFISHSAKERGAKALVTELVARLQAEDFDVLCDHSPQRLEPGSTWRAEINSWIVKCHAAVVVFSPHALKSDWVRKEVTNLALRKSQVPNFSLIPVLVGGVTPQDLRNKRFEPDQLGELQAMIDTAAVADTVAILTSLLSPVGARYGTGTPYERLTSWLATQLAKIPERDRERAAGTFGLDLAAWNVSSDDKVDIMARRLLDRLDQGMDTLFNAAQELWFADPNVAYKIYDAAVAFAWVDVDAATALRRAICGSLSQQVTTNTELPLTGRMYVRSACDGDPQCVELSIGWWEEPISAVIDEVRKMLIGKVGAPGWSDVTLNLVLRKSLVVLLVPFALISHADLIVELKRTFPPLRLFFLAGNRNEADVAAQLEGVEYLRPPIDPDREAECLLSYDTQTTILRRPQSMGVSA